MAKKRKSPLRKCVVTREMLPKETLIRIVRNKDGEVSVDPTGKKNGRGAYISKTQDVLLKAQSTEALATHLKTVIDPSVYEHIQKLIDSEQS